MRGSNEAPRGIAARIRSRYARAAAVVVTGGERFGIATARANRAALAGTTSASTAPSRKCACQSSGRMRVISSMSVSLQDAMAESRHPSPGHRNGPSCGRQATRPLPQWRNDQSSRRRPDSNMTSMRGSGKRTALRSRPAVTRFRQSPPGRAPRRHASGAVRGRSRARAVSERPLLPDRRARTRRQAVLLPAPPRGRDGATARRI